MSIIQGTSKAAGGAGYEIDQSIRFNDNDSAYLYRTPSAGDRKTWTFSTWIKRGNIDTAQVLLGCFSTYQSYLRINADNKMQLYNERGSTSNWTTTQVFRDPGAWMHIVWQYDVTQATVNNRQRLWINGGEVTDFTRTSTAAQNTDGTINIAAEHRLFRQGGSTNYYDGYAAEINFVDGIALDETSFGETNDDGVWIPKAYSGAYGTNGFYITGATDSDLGEDFSGNNNDFTSSGLATTDQMLDTPTNNFCTWNPLDKNASITLSDGNLKLAVGAVDSSVRSTFAASSGKWYWEITITSSSGAGTVGVTNSLHSLSSTPGGSTVGVGYRCSDGGKVINGTYTASYGASYTTGDVIGVALNMEDGEVTFYKNNASQGVAATGLSGTLFAAAGNENVSSLTWTANFGQTAFTYTPPTDFLALSTANLATPTVTDGSAHFQPTLYTGTGASNAVSQSGNSTFQPDWVWIKGRSGATEHVLTDAVRGVTKELSSNDAGAEETVAQGLTTFGTAGFTVGTDGSYNTSSATYVGWQWKANGAGSSNTDGTISSTVSADTTSGFSIVSYVGNSTSGATVGHGLGAVPKMMILKDRDVAENWCIYHEELGPTKFLYFTTAAAFTVSNRWNDTAPTSSVFTLGNETQVNATGRDYVVYCFAEIPGYSSFGSYTGNGSANGPFIYTGFAPEFIMVKSSSNSGTYWDILDATRETFNTRGNQLFANSSDAEASNDHECDFLSNGFKWRDGSGSVNGSGYTIIYMAFAKHPFGGDGVAPATAR
jgi:hypothetical protein